MEKYRILKNGIGMKHGNSHKSGFVYHSPYSKTDYFLLDPLYQTSSFYVYNALFRSSISGKLIVTGVMVNKNEEVCKGKITNENGSSINGWCADVVACLPEKY